jgi:hypothetical protein
MASGEGEPGTCYESTIRVTFSHDAQPSSGEQALLQIQEHLAGTTTPTESQAHLVAAAVAEVDGPGFSVVYLWVPDHQAAECESLLVEAGFELSNA